VILQIGAMQLLVSSFNAWNIHNAFLAEHVLRLLTDNSSSTSPVSHKSSIVIVALFDHLFPSSGCFAL